MDSVFNAAVEEICCEGPTGLHLRDLWPKLTPTLVSLRLPFSEKSKRIILENLILIPGLKFENPDNTILTNLGHQCDNDVKIVASEEIRNGFLGISEIQASVASLSDNQRSILQRLAVARTNGIAQSELGKELRIQPKNLFYPLKTLETLGLIVRVTAIIRKKQANIKGSEPVHTNMLYLFRYGKHLGSQQRLEIFIEDKSMTYKEVGEVQTGSGVGLGEEVEKEDVRVKDFLPAMEAICGKLEKAPGKVLVVSEIKIDLGYRGTTGHRAWRSILHRLKDAQVVEECDTLVNKKKVSCLRLLRKLSPSQFEQKINGRGHDEVALEHSASLVKRGQITNQLVELPILRQIYETIDVAGSKGVTNTEVCRGLGLCSKEYHKRYFNQRIFKFGLHSQLETRQRNELYRLYTAGNFNPGSRNTTLSEKEMGLRKSTEKLESHNENLSHPKESEQSESIVAEASPDMSAEGEGKGSALLLQWQPQNLEAEPHNEVPCHDLAVSVPNDSTQLEKSLSTGKVPSRVRSHVKYPCLTTSTPSLQREQWILKFLQEEKFLIARDLHRRLESLEKEKNTMMDRRTLACCLNKLQKENQCKCIDVTAPSVTNCSRIKKTAVVLHPSVSNVTPDLLGQIHDKLRSFETQLRRQQSCSRRSNSQSVATVSNVQRVLSSTVRAEGLEHSKTMRNNGFVLAKMVRAKLLHVFLWGWVSCSPGWAESLLSNNNPACDMKNLHSTCVFFDLDLAIKSLPLELFLQVVGSAEKIKGMVEKCGNGLLLSGLPSQEYKCLMDTRAIGRLSWLVDMLRRLKLIRLVSKGCTEDEAERPHTALTHALEIKPYIEEPASTDFSPVFLFPDLRPQKRHDFVLSSRKTVEEYWSTLEYCYSAAKSSAALLAFPGSAVHEVFRPRSWASARVMTAGQRDELLKRVVTDDPSKKLSYNDCRKIAKDLRLDLEQVLRFYYDKRQNRITRIRRSSDADREEIYPISRKKRRNTGRVSSEHLTMVDGQSSADAPDSLLSSDKHFDDRQQRLMNSESYSCQLRKSHASNDPDGQYEPESFEENKETGMLIHRGLSKMNPLTNPARRKRFSWTEEADRKLVIEYATHRAALGATFNRVDWASISNLPAYPNACKRRIALLRRYEPFRKAVSRLCRMLADRYAQYLKIFPDKMLNGVDSTVDYTLKVDGVSKWDDFDDSDIKEMLDNVLRHKKWAKLQAVKDTIPGQECQGNNDLDDCGETKPSSQRLSRRKLPAKYVKLFNKGATISRLMHESVAIANAAELFKLIFMSSSTSPELPTVLAETLRRYSEHDLFSAFNYLREKKIMIGGNGKHFVLSRQFLQSTCSFMFPTDTGKYAANFATWLQERETDLMKEGIDIPLDLQCGEIFTLCAKLSSGELSIGACLPDEGVGEAEDNRTSKRKFECGEPESAEKCKKLKSSFVNDGDTSSRRDKGFPAIKLSLHRTKVSRSLAIESSNDESIRPAKTVDCTTYDDQMKEMCESKGSNHFMVNRNESPWEAMAAYARYVMTLCSNKTEAYLHPNLFKTLYLAIQKSGDQGLSMNEICKLLNIDDEKMLENVIDVLESFGRAIKVNAYDSIHIVDSLYRSKYFLTSVPSHAVTDYPEGEKGRHEDENKPFDLDNCLNNEAASEREVSPVDDEMHRVTILNLREDVGPSEVYKQSEVDPSQVNKGSKSLIPGSADNLTDQPLFPWINGDGTINEPVYSRLVRRILGVVMQNPGILEDGIISHMRCLNPQSCRKLLEIMILDNHVVPRKMHQMKSTEPPSILGTLLGDCSRKPKLICRVHYFANPTSTSFL